MPAALRRLARVATAISLAALLVPAGALADGGGKCTASACQVYTEAPMTAGGGGQQGPAGSVQGPNISTLPSKTRGLLSHAGKDKAALQQIASNPGYGVKRGDFLSSGPASVASPGALGAAFDLGAGPTILLAILLATAVALAAHGGLRGWRRRRPSP